MMKFLFWCISEIRSYIMICFDAAVFFSLLWCVFCLLDAAVSRILLRGARHQAAGPRFMIIFAACAAGFSSAPAIRCKNLLRDILLPGWISELTETHIRNIISAISILWLGVAVLLLIRYARRRHTAAKCLYLLPDAPPDPAFARASRETGISPVRKAWDEAKGVSVFGVHKPVIIVPAGFALQYTEDERYYLYLHELTHILRRDTLINFLTDVCGIIFWSFPPLTWEMRRQRERRELCCDMAVLKRPDVEPAYYGKLLLREIKTANNRLTVGFSGHRYRQAKSRLDAVIGNTKALSMKILAIYLIGGALLISRFLTPASEMPYKRVVSVILTDGSFNTLYFEEDIPDRQDQRQLIERVYSDYDKRDIVQIIAQYPKFHYAGLFGYYLSAENEKLLPEEK